MTIIAKFAKDNTNKNKKMKIPMKILQK